jgi:hypothetical protein
VTEPRYGRISRIGYCVTSVAARHQEVWRICKSTGLNLLFCAPLGYTPESAQVGLKLALRLKLDQLEDDIAHAFAWAADAV